MNTSLVIVTLLLLLALMSVPLIHEKRGVGGTDGLVSGCTATVIIFFCMLVIIDWLI